MWRPGEKPVMGMDLSFQDMHLFFPHYCPLICHPAENSTI